jgi:drug/metabolite transporter (DMT)-like permease
VGRQAGVLTDTNRISSVVLWTLFIVLSTATQLAFKWAGLALHGLDFGQLWFDTAARTPAVGLAVAGYIVLFVIWMLILQRTDLTKAFALTGLIYVTVPAFGWLLFDEQLSIERMAGIVCIIGGVILMGRDGH